MNAYRRFFPKRHTFLAVVHVVNKDQTLLNVRIALGEGADGVFLINHPPVPSRQLYHCYQHVREVFPDAWIGLNWLDLSPEEGLDMMHFQMNGMWVDNAGIREDSHGAKEAILFAEKRRRWEKEMKDYFFLLFGGVAFKYQQHIYDVGRVAQLAVPYVDVITTSGDGTGMAPDVEKIRVMKNAIGDHPLAIASGITPENVSRYMEHTDCFLVATGVSDSHIELNPGRVRKLANAFV